MPETELALTIPCRTDKPDRTTPDYVVKLNELGGAERAVWKCRECGRPFRARHAWAKHAGVVPNVKGDCPGRR